MYLVKELPVKNLTQFICVWVHCEKIWSDIYFIDEYGEISTYNKIDDDWEVEEWFPWESNSRISNIMFVVLEKEEEIGFIGV